MIESGHFDKCECQHERFEHLAETGACARCIELEGNCQGFQRLLTYSVLVNEIMEERADHIWVSRRMAARFMNLCSPFTSLRFDGTSSFMGALLGIDESLPDTVIAFGVNKHKHVELI